MDSFESGPTHPGRPFAHNEAALECRRPDSGKEGDSLEARYANYVEIGHNDEEFVFDFGQSYEGEGEPVIHSRLVASLGFARELLVLLERSIREYEGAHRARRRETESGQTGAE